MASLSAVAALPVTSAFAAQACDPDCPRCNGVGLVPSADAKPFVWVEGSPAPKPEAMIGEQPCPQCQPGADAAALVATAAERLVAAHEQHAQWEARLSCRLTLVVTRHVALHSQFTPAQSKQVGQAIETLTQHVKRLAGSLLLTPTRPGQYEQVLLWERPAWDQFRKIMEGLYTPMQLGEMWPLARDYTSYDHAATPHLYESPQTIRQRPLTHGPVFLAARRQINVATSNLAPLWLAEGFAEYGDQVVHKANRWFTVYDARRRPPAGSWFTEAARLAASGGLRPWSKMLNHELRDWEPSDYVQSMGIVAFLFESEPGKFLEFVRQLKTGEDTNTALEAAFGRPRDELEERCRRWLLARR
jgi:hypothetical protein